jgi:thiamine biosynthesis lipoprotein
MSNRGTLRRGVHSNVIATAGLDGMASMMAGLYRGVAIAAAVAAVGCDRGGAPTATAAPEAVRVSDTRPLMGVDWTITVYAPDRAAGTRAIDAGFVEAHRLERILSDYDPASELSRLSAMAPTPEPVRVGADLWGVLVRAEEVHRLTNGAFDVTVGPLTTLWRQSRRSGYLPRPDKLAAAQEAVGSGTLVLDPARRAARLTRPGMRLDLGGIGMGYTADRVLRVLGEHGIASAMVDASGDVVVSESPPGTTGWRIRVAGIPDDADAPTVVLSNAAITTSGDANQFVEIDGRRYSHIVNPRTGLGVPGPAAVSVIAHDAATADAMATAASVAGPDEGPMLVSRFPGAAARFVWKDGEALTTRETPGWPAH